MPDNEFPSVGSIVSKELGPRRWHAAYIATMTSLPSSNAAYLGVEHNPFQTFGYPQSAALRVRNLVLARRRRSRPGSNGVVRCLRDSTIFAARPTPPAHIDGMDKFSRAGDGTGQQPGRFARPST